MSNASMGFDTTGTHEFTISALLDSDGTPYVGASGTIRFNRRDGLTFDFDIPDSACLGRRPSVEGIDRKSRAAGFYEISRSPSWRGLLANGKEFQLFETSGTTQHVRHFGQVDLPNRRILIGRAAFGLVTLSSTGLLGFQYNTPLSSRYFLAGVPPFHWPEEYEHNSEDGRTYSSRCFTLSRNPLIRVINADKDCGVSDGVWLLSEEATPDDIRTPPDSCQNGRNFLSFLMGRSVQFLWTDRFHDNGDLSRLYYGVFRHVQESLGHEQPLPLCRLKEIATSHEICAKMPALFEKFVAVDKQFNIDFISSPIRAAFDTYADDKLAFGCISLERLAAAHKKHCKSIGCTVDAKKHLTKEQGASIRQALSEKLLELKESLDLPNDVVNFLIDKKIANIHTPPNADSLKEVFTTLGIDLTQSEKLAIQQRNHVFHGSQTMTGTGLKDIESEMKRFDIIRTLVYKAVLRLLNYDGPYMDYGDVDAGKAFSIRVLVRRPQTE